MWGPDIPADWVIGADEVGTGAWAGPLMVGAVLCRPNHVMPAGVTDSKSVTPAVRQRLAPILQQSLTYLIGQRSHEDIDRLGLAAALRECYLSTVGNILKLVPETDSVIIVIDGSIRYNFGHYEVRTISGGDLKCPAVSAASILAKVRRDSFMKEEAERFPEYGFKTNVGYGSKVHVAALHKFGPCHIHRRSYTPIKNMLEG